MDSALITSPSSQQLDAVQGDEGRVSQIVLELVKAMKALRLYDRGNQIVEHRLAALERQLHPFLEEHRALTVRVLPFELRCALPPGSSHSS